jgi:2-dehydro-3-deoxyphosphogalactonate aldolase
LLRKAELENQFPLIAILRGILPDDIIPVASVLVAEGFTMIEVPLNSPDALLSIKKLVSHFGEQYCVGAGTVTNAPLAKDVIATGANLIVSPNFDKELVQLSVAAGCITLPGVATATEAFAALAAGASGLKLFPASMLGLDGFKALKSVMPKDVRCFPVGGINITQESMQPYLAAGASGFGLGASLYQPAMSHESIRQNARKAILAFKACLARL